MKTIYVTSAINVNLQDGALLRLKAGANEIEDDRFEEVVGNWFVKAHLADGAPLPADHAAELAAKDAQLEDLRAQQEITAAAAQMAAQAHADEKERADREAEARAEAERAASAKDAQITEMQEQIAALQAAVDAASAANSAGKKAKATADQGA